jgi:hypothetical protein
MFSGGSERSGSGTRALQTVAGASGATGRGAEAQEDHRMSRLLGTLRQARTALVALALLAIALPLLSGRAATPAAAQAPSGAWTAYPGQSTVYQVAVQQPLNADGSSNFRATGTAG